MEKMQQSPNGQFSTFRSAEWGKWKKTENLTLRSLTEGRHQGEFFVTATNLRQIISSLNHCVVRIVRANAFLLMQVKPVAECSQQHL